MRNDNPVHSIDLLEEALKVLADTGVEVRQEWLGESTGGVCRVGSKQILYLDISLSARDQLNQAVQGLRCVPEASQANMSSGLASIVRAQSQ